MSESYGYATFSQSARHRVRNGVEQKILCGEFPSGTKLRQVRLAKHFGVGQGVVREALIELQLMGLVEIFDNRGVFVTHLNSKKLKDAIEVRAAIEGMAVRPDHRMVAHTGFLTTARLVGEGWSTSRAEPRD